MSLQIPVAFVQQFRSNIIVLCQQKGSRLRNYVMTKDVTGKYDHFERIGATAMVARTSRHGDTPLVNTPHSRRRVLLADWEWADLIDKQDSYKMLIDPQSTYSQNAGYAAGRTMDTLILNALGGNSVAVDADDAASNVALPSGQKVAVDFGGSTVGLTLAKVRRAKKILDAGEAPDEDRVLTVTAQMLEAMLGVTEVVSADYNAVKALVNGDINSFLGFKWVRTELLYTITTNVQASVAFQRTGVGLGIGQDVTTRISERADKSYSVQVYLAMGLGATRVEEEKVVEIACSTL